MPRPGRAPDGAPRRDIFLSLGSNRGDRSEHLAAGLAGLAARGVRPVAGSPVYRTEPVGGPPQEDFLNLAVEVETRLGPEAVLDVALDVEAERGRVRGGGPGAEERWGPRPLDVDLLLFGEAVVRTARLQVPHPRLHLRRFVLIPLADLAAARTHPVEGLTVRELLARCPDRSAVIRHAPPLPLPGGGPDARLE